MTNIFPDELSRYQAYNRIFRQDPVGTKVFTDLMLRVLPTPAASAQEASNHGVAGYALAMIAARDRVLAQLQMPAEPTEVREEPTDDGRDDE